MRKSFRKRYKSREQFKDMLLFKRIKRYIDEAYNNFLELLNNLWRTH